MNLESNTEKMNAKIEWWDKIVDGPKLHKTLTERFDLGADRLPSHYNKSADREPLQYDKHLAKNEVFTVLPCLFC